MLVTQMEKVKYGRYSVLGVPFRVRWNNNTKRIVVCRCDCGEVRAVSVADLVSGRSRSCGCLQKDVVGGLRRGSGAYRECGLCGKAFQCPPSNGNVYCSPECRKASPSKLITHGMSRSRLYGIWSNMRGRCSNPSNMMWKYYGGRGIAVCQEWESTFECFRDWANASGYSEELEIDRIDNNRGYSPDNCRWATRCQQMANTRKRKNAKTSRFRGVSWCSSVGKWRAQIVCQDPSVRRHVGVFQNEVEAAKAYDSVAKMVFGEFASLNFKDE